MTGQKLSGNTNRQRLRNICFTINNPIQEIDALVNDLVGSGKVGYLCIGQEVGACGTEHYQGYIEFLDRVEWAVAHQMLLRGHMEHRCGTAQQASDYCKKDGAFMEWGKMSNQGCRTDIEQVAEALIAGYMLTDIALEYPVQYIKFHKGIQALQAKLIKPRCVVPEVRLYWGGTGTGKSYQAREWLPNAYVWHPQMGTWFDGYEGQNEVIFEEFRGQIPFGMVLSLLDRYCCKVQYKGGVQEFNATKIAFTSPVHYSEWFFSLNANDRLEQLSRRLTSVIKCKRKADE